MQIRVCLNDCCMQFDLQTKKQFYLFFRSLILSYVYIFCYINVEDTKTKPRIIIFYTVTFIENVLLVVLWTLSVKASLDFEKSERQTVIISVVVLFVTGICFMLLYYQLFHVSKLGTGNGNPDQIPNGLNCRSSLVPNDKSHTTGNCNQVWLSGSFLYLYIALFIFQRFSLNKRAKRKKGRKLKQNLAKKPSFHEFAPKCWLRVLFPEKTHFQ